MPNVHCGQNYTVTVVASNEKCNSDPSKADTLQSGETFRRVVLFYSLDFFEPFSLNMCE